MKKLASIVCTLAIMLTVCATMPASAVANSEDTASSYDSLLLENAPIEVTKANDGTYEITLSQVTPLNDVSVQSDALAPEQKFVASEAKFIAYTEEEANQIVEQLNVARASSYPVNDDLWFLGSSCYISISLQYTKTTGSKGTLCRIESVTVTSKSNSGTTITSRVLHMGCSGTTASNGGFYDSKNINVTTSTYTTTYPKSWPYIYNSGPMLGASFEVTASRSSGSSATKTVSAPVFIN